MLLDHLAGRPVVSIVGLTKNTGKTTTFNHLVRQATERGTPLGLTSIGRNGEAWDAITREPKPPIWAPEGAWIVTAETAIAKSQVRLRQQAEVTNSPFGSIVLGQVETPGHVELIGPQTSSGVATATRALRQAGAGLVMLDGTFARRFTATADLCDGLVLATGATAGNTPQAVVERTRYLADLFRLAAPPEPLRSRAAAALQAGSVALLTSDGASVTLPFRTGLGNGPAIAERLRAHAGCVEALVLPGGLANGLADDLAAAGGPLAIVVGDPACLLLDAPHARRLRDAGITLHALAGTSLLAVTVNPYKGAGQSYPADELREALTAALAPVAVINVAEEE